MTPPVVSSFSSAAAASAAIDRSAMAGTAQSILRRAPLKLTTTRVTDESIFIIDFALRGVGTAIIRSGT